MDVQGALNLILIVGVILAGIGYAVGTFLTQRRKGAADALAVALDEIEELRTRADRLADEMTTMRTELAKISAENHPMREILSGGTFLADQIRNLVAAETDRGVQIIAGLIRGET